MTTPEQLTKWREEAYLSLTKEPDNWGIDGGGYEAGYLRAKQETEQAMKLAKFGAMVLSKFDYPDQEEIASELDLLRFDDRKQQYELAAGIEATIKELLND